MAYLGTDEMIILNVTLEKYIVRFWSGANWTRIQCNSGICGDSDENLGCVAGYFLTN